MNQTDALATLTSNAFAAGLSALDRIPAWIEISLWILFGIVVLLLFILRAKQLKAEGKGKSL